MIRGRRCGRDGGQFAWLADWAGLDWVVSKINWAGGEVLRVSW